MSLFLLLAAAGNGGAAPPPSSIAYFGSGSTSASTATPTALVDAYNLTTAVVASGANLSYSTFSPGAAGNTSVGVWAGGYNYVANTSVYTYAANTTAAGTGLPAAAEQLSGASNPTTGAFLGGEIQPGGTRTNNYLYTFANNAVNTGTALTNQAQVGGSAGNNNLAVCAGGLNSSGTVLSSSTVYTYSTGSAVNGTALTTVTYGLAGCGTPNVGYFAGGYNGSTTIATTSKYTYLTNAVAGGTNITVATYQPGAAANSTIGVWVGGGTATGGTVVTNVSSVYTWATDAVAGGTNLGTARYGIGGTCTTPGGFIPSLGLGVSYSAGGYNGAATGLVYTYNMATNAVGTGTSLTYALYNMTGMGTSTKGVFCQGNAGVTGPQEYTQIYTYSSNTVSQGSNTPTGGGYAGSNGQCGNSTYGIIAGYSGGAAAGSRTVQWYTYSSNAWLNNSGLTYATYLNAATSNATTGICAAGTNSTGTSGVATTNIITLGGSPTFAGGTNLLYSVAYVQAASTASLALIAGGYTSAAVYTSTTNTYTYSNNAVAAGTNLAYGIYAAGMAGNALTAVIMGGALTAATSVCSTYTYSSSVTAPGTYLPAAIDDNSAVCSSPGGGYT